MLTIKIQNSDNLEHFFPFCFVSNDEQNKYYNSWTIIKTQPQYYTDLFPFHSGHETGQLKVCYIDSSGT